MNNLKRHALFMLAITLSFASHSNEMSPSFLKKEIDLAHHQYLTGSLDSGKYALEALARLIEADDTGLVQENLGPNNLSFTYLRLGLLHEQSGNQLEANTYFDKALSHFTGKSITVAELKNLVNTIDSRQK